MLAAYVTAHGFGHVVRLCEVLAAIRARAPALHVTVVGQVPEAMVRAAVAAPLSIRPVVCDTGVLQHDALRIDVPATAAACAAFDAQWAARLADEVAWLRASGARAVLADVPPLAVAAGAAAGLPTLAMTNFGWDWIFRNLPGQRDAPDPSLQRAADRATEAYGAATLLLALPFDGGLEAFRARRDVGLVARRPQLPAAETRRRLGIDPQVPLAVVSFGGIGLPGLDRRRLVDTPALRWLLPEDLAPARLIALGLTFPDVVSAADAVVSKPGYGVVSDCIAAGAPLVYAEREGFAEYDVMVPAMQGLLACRAITEDDARAGRFAEAVEAVRALPRPPAPDLGGAARAAQAVLDVLAA